MEDNKNFILKENINKKIFEFDYEVKVEEYY